jgi:site-specific recombinase XerD
MFENIYSSNAACKRHRAGSLAAERERYLQHCAEQGCTHASLYLKACCLLWIAERVQPSDLNAINSSRLRQIIHEGPFPANSPATATTLINTARPWFKFLGWWQEPTAEPIPFEENLEFFVSWMRDERGLTPCTISQWRSRAATFLRWCFNTGRRFSTLSPEDIDAYFITYGAQRWSRISARHVATMLRVFLRYAATQGACSSTLADSIHAPRHYALESLPYALSWEDVQRVLATTNSSSEGDVRDRAILMLLAVYGLRRGEVAALRLDQIDWAAGQLRIWRLKRRQPQVYPLAFTVAEALAQYIDTVRPKVLHPEIFIRTRAPRIPISAAGLYNIVSGRLRLLNIQAAHLGPHALRHACAARLLANGLSLKEIGDHLGHRSTSATMTYTKVDLVSLREVGDFDLGDLL